MKYHNRYPNNIKKIYIKEKISSIFSSCNYFLILFFLFLSHLLLSSFVYLPFKITSHLLFFSALFYCSIFFLPFFFSSHLTSPSLHFCSSRFLAVCHFNFLIQLFYFLHNPFSSVFVICCSGLFSSTLFS